MPNPNNNPNTPEYTKQQPNPNNSPNTPEHAKQQSTPNNIPNTSKYTKQQSNPNNSPNTPEDAKQQTNNTPKTPRQCYTTTQTTATPTNQQTIHLIQLRNDMSGHVGDIQACYPLRLNPSRAGWPAVWFRLDLYTKDTNRSWFLE